MSAQVSSSSAASAAPLPPKTYAPRQPSAKNAAASSSKHRIEHTDLTPNNIGQVKRLNSVLLPVAYSERFYKDALKEEVRDICQIGLFNDIPVGSIICRYELQGKDKVKVYIMSLGVLAPYRRLGIASMLLSNLLTAAKPGTRVQLPDPDAPKPPPPPPAASGSADKKKKEVPKVPTKEYEVESVYLHVQTSNEEAKQFYEKHGFTVAEELKEYYRPGVEPRSAWLVELR